MTGEGPQPGFRGRNTDSPSVHRDVPMAPPQGIDLRAGGRVANTHRVAPRSEDVYLRLLVKLYRFLARRTDSKFAAVVLKRLSQSRVNRGSIAISRIAKQARGASADAIVVIVGNVLNDSRMLEAPKVRVSLGFRWPGC